MTHASAAHDGPPHQHALREAGTLALYLSIVILALLVGFGAEDSSISEEVRLIWGSAIGLGVAHLFAYRMTAVFAAGGRLTKEDVGAILGMIAAVVVIASIATLPYLFIDNTLDASTLAMVLLLVVIAIAAFLTAQRAGLHGLKALGYTVLTVGAAGIVVIIKYVLTH